MNNKEIIIIQQGDRAKFRIKSNRPDFDIATMDFELEIIYGMKGKSLKLPKSAFVVEDNDYVFSFPTDKVVGYLVFRMVMQIPDNTLPESVRQEVDEQEFCFVTATACTHLRPHIGCADKELDVIYEYVSYNGETPLLVVLRDSDGKFLRDSDQLLLRALKKETI